MAQPLLWMRQPDTVGVLGLALNACQERNGIAEPIDQIRELLEAARSLWRAAPEEEEPERMRAIRATARLVHLADILAVTGGAHPPEPR
jgi:hypothetical protein